MALGFGEITPAGHIEFGCPDLVGLVGDKVPRPTQSHARARVHTHTHTYTHAYIHLVPPHRWRYHRYGRQPSLRRRAEASAVCCGHGGSGCDQVGGRAGVSVRQNQSIACNVLVSLNDGIDYFTLKQTFVTLARRVPKLRAPPRLALPGSNCMAHRQKNL